MMQLVRYLYVKNNEVEISLYFYEVQYSSSSPLDPFYPLLPLHPYIYAAYVISHLVQNNRGSIIHKYEVNLKISSNLYLADSGWCQRYR